MATLGATAYTYADWVTKVDPDGTQARIVELLSQENPIITDAAVVEGNLPTGHVSTIRTGLPAGTWRLLNYGVQPEKSSTMKVTDTCGMLETYALLDKALANLNGNSAEFRASESVAFLQGLNRTFASTLFYGNTGTNPEKFMGLAPRFNSLSAQNGKQIIDASGTGSDNTSIWFVNWSDRTTHLIFPKGGRSGLLHEDLGERTEVDSSGNRYQALTDHYKWDVGLVVKDWRYVSRIANIDVSDLATAGASGYSGANIPNLLIKAMHKLYTMGSGNTVIYCNRTTGTALDLIASNKTNVWLDIRSYAGEMVTHFRGIPIRQCDAILDTEARVV